MNHARTLLDRSLDDLATPAEAAELGRLLAADAALADEFARLSRLEALLEEALRDRRAEAVGTRVLATASRGHSCRTGFQPVPSPRTGYKPVLPKRRWLLVAAVLLLAVGAAVLRSVWRPQPDAPSETLPQGDVVSGKVRVDGVEGGRITEGARVEVAGDQTAVLRLPDGTRAELAPDSELRVQGRGDGLRQTVDLGRGGGKFEVADGRLRVRTPLGTVTAGPSAFSVELKAVPPDEEDFMYRNGTVLLVVAALVGDVEVSVKGRNYVVGAGQARAFAQDGEVRGKPNLGGRVVAVATDGATLTIETPVAKAEPTRTTVRITASTKMLFTNVDTPEQRKPAAGDEVSVWLEEGGTDRAAQVRLTRPQVILRGKILDVAADGKSFTLETIPGKGEEPRKVAVRLTEQTKLVPGAERQPKVDLYAQVWLRIGSPDTAGAVQFSATATFPSTKGGDKPKEPEKKPQPTDPDKKPQPKEPEKKPQSTEPDKKPQPKDPEKKPQPKDPDKKPTSKEPPAQPLPTRDPAPAVAAIDRAWRNGLDHAKIAPADEADDAEFCRRVHLDLVSHIPTDRRARAFLDSTDPDKRRKLVDELLSSPEFGRHFGERWRHLLAPPVESSKPSPDTLTPWLAEQLNRNRGWDAVVRDLITAEGPVRGTPQLGYVLANGDVLRPKPELLADSTGRLFLGVSLGCAQCHDHPFGPWKQTDFWGLAAFYGRVRPDNLKGGPNVSILESDAPLDGEKAAPRGPAIVVKSLSGKAAGKVVRARFPGGAELAEDVPGPYRVRLADWMTARDNPYFARAQANRLWAALFGRGLVEPLDTLDVNTAANPELLDVVAKEFADSGYDVKHLLRCLCLSRPYQRTSRTAPGAPRDDRLFSHMTVRPLNPEALYDSLAVVGLVDAVAAEPRPKGAAPAGGMTREQFVHFFRAQGDAAGGLNQGIPQVLTLLNGKALHGGGPLVARLCDGHADPAEALETLFLAVYARRPTPAEVALVGRYLDRESDVRAGYDGVLWALLNSSEFILNH